MGRVNLQDEAIKSWLKYSGVSISEGVLQLNKTTINRKIDSLIWRFKLECRIRTLAKGKFTLTLSDGEHSIISLSIGGKEISSATDAGNQNFRIDQTEWTSLLVEGDLTHKRFNLYANGKLLQYFVPMTNKKYAAITDLINRLIGRGNKIPPL